MKELINWRALSRLLTGSDFKIRSDSENKKYPIVAEILAAIKKILDNDTRL